MIEPPKTEGGGEESEPEAEEEPEAGEEAEASPDPMDEVKCAGMGGSLLHEGGLKEGTEWR